MTQGSRVRLGLIKSVVASGWLRYGFGETQPTILLISLTQQKSAHGRSNLPTVGGLH